SPNLGSVADLFIWYMAFFIFPLLAFFSHLLLIFFVIEKKKWQSHPSFRNYAFVVLSVFKYEGRWLFTIYLAGGVCLFTLFGILFYLSDVLEETYLIEGFSKGLILAIPLLILVTTSYTTGQKIGKNLEKMKRLIIIGLAL